MTKDFALCLKIIEKVSFYIASGAFHSHLSEQKFIKNAKIESATFWVIFKHCAGVQKSRGGG